MTLFNTIPGNLVAPIVAFEVNSGGQFENQARVLHLGHKITAGVAAANTPVIVTSTQEARRLFGAGSMLDDMARAHFRNAPAQELWAVAAPATGTAEVRTITVGTPPAAGGVGVLEIAGHPVTIVIGAGDNDDAVAAAIGAAINAFYDPLSEASLPYTAAVASEVVTITARHAGAVMSDIDIHVPVLATTNAFTGLLTFATTTAGSGAPDLSAALAALGDDLFDWIVSPFSDDTNIGRYKALLNDLSGRWAWNRQLYGHVFYPKTATTGDMTTHGLAQDDRHLTALPRPASGSIPEPAWEWAAAIAARIAPWLIDGANGNVSRNQTGLVVEGIKPPRDRSKWYGYATRDAFLRSGISTWAVDGAGRVVIDKIITTQRTTNGVVDTTFRDIQKIGQLVYALRRFRTALTTEHGQKAIANDNPGNVGAVSTPRDIAATFMHTYREMVLSGVLENPVQAAQALQVKRNSDNPNRVDIYAPIDMVNPLDVIAANAVVYSQFRASV
jgi:phage tail sheath gpL-like